MHIYPPFTASVSCNDCFHYTIFLLKGGVELAGVRMSRAEKQAFALGCRVGASKAKTRKKTTRKARSRRYY